MTLTEWYSRLPAEKLSRKAFDALPDYSLSIPTGTFVGKVWKRDLAVGDPDESPKWVICEYVDVGSSTQVGIDYRRPEVSE